MQAQDGGRVKGDWVSEDSQKWENNFKCFSEDSEKWEKSFKSF